VTVVRRAGRPAIHDLPRAPARTVDPAAERVDWRKAAVAKALKLRTTSLAPLAGVSFYVCRLMLAISSPASRFFVFFFLTLVSCLKRCLYRAFARR